MRIEGLDKLIIKLDKLSGASLEQALEKSCLIVESDAKEECPVDDGQLRQSITHEVYDYEGAVGTNVEYAPYVHQGTGIYAVKGDGRKTRWSYKDSKGKWHSTIGQKPNPFLERALSNNKDNILDIFKKEIKEATK